MFDEMNETDDLEEMIRGSIAPQKFYGKYRGTVVNNVDPMHMGRITATVPDVSDLVPTSWAMPCLPFAFTQSGMFALPPSGSGVWIEFEQGDPDRPIWCGGWWGESEIPTLAEGALPAAPHIVLQTTGKNTLLISGDPTKGIKLSAGPIDSNSSPQIIMTPTSIVIQNGSCKITVTSSEVNINNGALTVSAT